MDSTNDSKWKTVKRRCEMCIIKNSTWKTYTMIC